MAETRDLTLSNCGTISANAMGILLIGGTKILIGQGGSLLPMMDCGVSYVIDLATLPIRVTPLLSGSGKGPPPSKGSKGKGRHGDRSWKSQKFRAGYHSEQATPALHDKTPSTDNQEWWESHELVSVAIDQIQPKFFLVDADDNEVADYIDLIILAIVNNMERQDAYLRNPSTQLRREILENSTFITTAENCTKIHIQRIIRSFKTSIHYHEVIINGNIMEHQETKLTNNAKANESPTDNAKATESPTENAKATESPTETLIAYPKRVLLW
jgi:hypothetical protein